ncbi:MAG: hypothetical protein ACLQLC_02255 [Candidatus Sulfotelmatobacter sp.]
MKSSLRPTSISDLKALSQFLMAAFDAGPAAPFLDPALMAWKYWDGRDDWSGPRSYVLEKDGAIVAHAGLWPITWPAAPQAARGIHMIDWASSSDSPGAGLALVQKLAAMFDFIYSIGGSEMTCKVLPAFGFIEYTRQWKGARPLRPLRQILTHQTRTWKLAPRLLRNSLLAMTKGANPYQNWQAIAIQPEKLSGESYLSQAAGASFSPRPPAFFEYLLRCPSARFRLYGIMAGRELKGHFVISVLRGQARIAGVWLREPTSEAWTAAYFLARQTALGLRGCNEVVVFGSENHSRTAAAHAGFRIMPGPTLYLLDKQKKLSLAPDFQFQLADGDLAFLDSGKPSYWT